METINIQLKRPTIEPESTPPTPVQSETPSTSPDQYYELLRDAPDNYFTKQQTHSEIDPDLNIHHDSPITNHVTIKTSCNDQRQPLLNEDLAEHLQFDKERNLSYLPISTSLTLKRKRHMYYIPMDFQNLTLDGLIDTGALTSAISEQDLNKIKLLANDAIKETGPPPNFQIMVANGQLEVPIGTVLLEFEVADFMLKENFIIMKTLPNPLIGLCFLRRHNAIFDVTQGILTFPYLSMQLKPDTQTAIRQATPLFAENTYTLRPGETLAIASKMPHLMDHNATGIVTPSQQFENHDSIFITASLSTVNNNAIGYQIINFSELPYTITTDTHLADFKILTPEQIKHIQPVDPAVLSFMIQHEETTEVYINELLKVPQPNSEQESYWFPTPDDPGDPTTYTPIQQRIYNELLELKELEKLNPHDNETSRKTFLSNFDWTDTTLSSEERQEIEEILVEFHDIFARHRFDIGINREFKVKLTPNDDRPAYSQSLPTPINLKDDITVELALLHKYGIITTLPFSKYASPIFAQRKPNGRLRLLVDLRKINNLITEDYANNNHPVSTLSDAAQHMAGKKLFCKLDCSQAYHCLQMADYQPIQMLAFNFASRTFAYRRLAQGLSRSLSAFSSFMREYLDRAIKADQCAQYVDDIGIAANDTKQLCINIKTVFECIRNAGLKLSMSKCHFGVKQVDFLGRTTTPDGVAPQADKVKDFLAKLKFPKSKKALQRYIGFLNYYRNYIPRLSERLTPFFKLLKETSKFYVPTNLVEDFTNLNQLLENSCQLALKQPLKDKQLIVMSDASFTAAGYAIMIEDDPNQKLQSKRKTYAPIAFGSKTFNPTQTKMSIYAKEFLSIYFAFVEFGHLMWGSTFPVIVFTDNRSVTRFFQTKMIPPALWNACDYVLQYNFVIAHVAGSMNTAADFLSRTESNPTEKLEMTIRNDIHTKAIEVNIQSTGIVEEEQIYILPDEEIDENQLWEEKQNTRNQAQNETHNDPENNVSELQQFHKPTSGLISCSSGHFKDNARIRLEQNNDIVLRNLRAKIEGEPFDENELASDFRYQHYLQNITRIEIKHEVLTRKYYTDTGMISHYQILLPIQLLEELLQALHGHNSNHPGITKMIQETRQKYYYPCMAKYIKKWVSNCQICIQTKRINNDLLRTELLNCPEWDLGPEDILQMDILPNLPPSGGYDHIITAIDVFSRYLFAYPVTRITATTVSKVIMDILCKHTYLPTTIITDLGTQFNAQVTHEIAAVLGIEMKHATMKHAQTIGLLERTHASVKTHLKAATGEFRNNWHKYLPLAVLNHNTTYHASLGCEPSRVFHGRIPHNILDYKLGYNPNPRYQPQTDVAEEIQKRMRTLLDQTKKNIMQSYLKYKAYYDRKAKAAPLETTDYCYILNPKADTQATKIPFREFRWCGPYKVEKVLPNNNYIVRRLGTNKTQLLHRIRLRKFTPQAPLADIFVRETDWQKDDQMTIANDDLYAQSWNTNFGANPFDDIPSDAIHNTEDTEYVPIQIPDNSRPPSPVSSKNSGGSPVDQTTEPDQKHGNHADEIPQQSNDNNNTQKTRKDVNNATDNDNQKTPENSQNTPLQEEPINTRGEKYNLRPNPNPNYSDTYRY